jgi:hypothetical protein
MSDRNPEQWINIEFYGRIGNSASEMSALLTLAYDEYATKSPGFMTEVGGSRKGPRIVQPLKGCMVL